MKIMNMMKLNENSFIGILVVSLMILFGVAGCVSKCDRDKIDILEQNLKAAQDTIDVIKLDNGKLLYEKSSYVLNEKELLKQLNITKEELAELKKKVGQPTFITDIETVIKYDTIKTIKDTIIYRNNNIDYTFHYNDEWLRFDGNTIFKDSTASTNIYNISIPTNLRVGLTKDYKIFVIPQNPYMTISNIEGAILDKSSIVNKPKFSHGLTIGLGVQYGIINKQFDIGPQISYGLHINF